MGFISGLKRGLESGLRSGVGVPAPFAEESADTSGYSLVLDRSSSQFANITDANQTGLDPGGDFTFECWFKLASTPGTGEQYAFASKELTGPYRFYLYESGGSHYIWILCHNGTTLYGLTCPITPSTSNWVHLAFVYDASAQWQNQKIYLDTVSQTVTVERGTGTDVVGALNDTGAQFRLGNDSGGKTWDGKLDEVRFWNEARSGTEIANNWKSNLTGSETNLDGYWRLENDYTDETANGNDLTGQNSPTFSSSDTPY